ncbi:unnamed protein product, partial [Scytosiphon promiscuus]
VTVRSSGVRRGRRPAPGGGGGRHIRARRQGQRRRHRRRGNPVSRGACWGFSPRRRFGDRGRRGKRDEESRQKRGPRSVPVGPQLLLGPARDAADRGRGGTVGPARGATAPRGGRRLCQQHGHGLRLSRAGGTPGRSAGARPRRDPDGLQANPRSQHAVEALGHGRRAGRPDRPPRRQRFLRGRRPRVGPDDREQQKAQLPRAQVRAPAGPVGAGGREGRRLDDRHGGRERRGVLRRRAAAGRGLPVRPPGLERPGAQQLGGGRRRGRHRGLPPRAMGGLVLAVGRGWGGGGWDGGVISRRAGHGDAGVGCGRPVPPRVQRRRRLGWWRPGAEEENGDNERATALAKAVGVREEQRKRQQQLPEAGRGATKTAGRCCRGDRDGREGLGRGVRRGGERERGQGGLARVGEEQRQRRRERQGSFRNAQEVVRPRPQQARCVGVVEVRAVGDIVVLREGQAETDQQRCGGDGEGGTVVVAVGGESGPWQGP